MEFPLAEVRYDEAPFSAVVWSEGKWFVAQCLEVDVASQGRTKEEALANLREALELFSEKTKTHCCAEVGQD